MDKKQVLQLLAQILAGAQVPVSIDPLALGTGYNAYIELRAELSLSGWNSEWDYFNALVQVFTPQEEECLL